MNGDEVQSFDAIGETLNQPDIQENYPTDFTGYMFEEPVFVIEEAAYTPPPSVSPEEFSAYQERTRGEFAGQTQPFNIETAAYTPPPLMEEASTVNQLVNLFGKVLDVGGKTYQQLATTKEVQNLKSTPFVSSALNNLGYPSVRKAQSGIDTGILTTKASPIKQAVSSIASLSPVILIAGVGILFLVMKGEG